MQRSTARRLLLVTGKAGEALRMMIRAQLFSTCAVLLFLSMTGCETATVSRMGLPLVDEAVIEFVPDASASQPDVNHESYSVLMHTELIITAADGVLRNDRFVEELEPVTGLTEAGGFVELDSTGAFRYVPPVGFVGADHFTYHVTNTYGAARSRVLIKVISPGDVPVP